MFLCNSAYYLTRIYPDRNRLQPNSIDNEYIYEVSMNIRTMAEMSGAKALMDSLEKEGVDIVFGLPGGANLPIYDALVDANFRHVLVRHEQSALIWLMVMLE